MVYFLLPPSFFRQRVGCTYIRQEKREKRKFRTFPLFFLPEGSEPIFMSGDDKKASAAICVAQNNTENWSVTEISGISSE